MNQPLIECKDLSHCYGEKNVLENLSFTVEKGGVFGLLGKNGAGKSTTINILMGFLRPSGGQCKVLGEPSHSLSWQARSRIGLLQEGFIQYDFMKIHELESYFAPFYPLWDRAMFYDLVDKLGVPHTRKLHQLSCGQRSQVVLGLIMAQKPELMILDDYSMGLDVGYRRLFIEFLREYVHKYGTTVMLTSHVVQELDHLIDHMIVLDKGQVSISGTKKEFMDTFSCYQFARTRASEKLGTAMGHQDPGPFFTLVEHQAAHTRVYGFMDKDQARHHLSQLNIAPINLEPVDISFEDAFVGLTGKY